MYMGIVCGLVVILLIVLILTHDKGGFMSYDTHFKIDRRKDKERYKAFFYKRYKNQYPDQASLERAFEESWKKIRE
ncbi:MAG TPA: hypothetical protein DD409_10505 [Bacteroidales bacterium]|nr:hypothetical protein [Bacteroidales bacterium]